MANDINGTNPLLDQLGIQNKQAKKDEDKKDLGQDDFFKIMIAQIQNQSPLKPQENGEFLGQMAQLESLNSMKDMASSLDRLNTNLMSSQALQASSLVGRFVMIPADKGVLPEGEGDRFFGAVDVQGNANNVNVDIKTSSGELVRTLQLGNLQDGLGRFAWDGKDNEGKAVAAGEYKVSASGTVGADVLSLETNIIAPVDSVTLGRNGGKMQLNVAGYGAMGIDSVKEIL